MAAPLVAIALLLQTSSGATLPAAAQASMRPRECAPQTKRGHALPSPNVWDVVREPNLRRYCDLVARGFAELGGSARSARDTAEIAEEVSPGHAAPKVLEGRADVALGAYVEALAAFAKARAIDSRALEEPGAVHDLAVAQYRTGHVADALATYRALAPRVELIAGADRRVRVLLEAAELSMSLGPTSLDDAIALLREARQVPIREARPRVLAMLALALDRKGAAAESSDLAEELARLGGETAAVAFTNEGLGTGEGDAALALALEATDPSAAAKAWEAYLAGRGGKGPWVEHARRRIDSLRKRAKPEIAATRHRPRAKR
jgi:tetratricopeptide (TPR) repeat protein